MIVIFNKINNNTFYYRIIIVDTKYFLNKNIVMNLIPSSGCPNFLCDVDENLEMKFCFPKCKTFCPFRENHII